MKELAPHRLRVVDECRELEERLGKLQSFIKTDVCLNLPFDDRVMLVRQERVMRELVDILKDRIARFFEEA